MKTEDARKALEAARAEATKMGKAVTVVVVDNTGTMVILERLNNANPFTAIVAEGKAVASATMGRTSAQIAETAKVYPALVQSMVTRLGGRFMALQGAVPVLDASGAILGAVGVSGAASEEDEQIASAGAAAIKG